MSHSEPEPEYVPMTVVTGEVPDYQPIGRIVASGSNGAASQEFVSPQTNAAGSLFPVLNQPASAPALTLHGPAERITIQTRVE